ncbi:beta-N-acetylhexosaminidase, partial [Streptomyces halstedii]
MTSDDTTAPGLIPAPREVTWGAPGAEPFRLDAATVLTAPPGTEGVARLLRATVGAATGLPLADGTDGHRVELALDA